MKKLLITGISGFLSHTLAPMALKQYEVHGLYMNNPVKLSGIQTYKIDCTDTDAMRLLFDKIAPDAVIHTAAASKPNYCEIYQKKSYSINVTASVHLAALCAHNSIPFVYTSTDQVFNGKNAPYTETAQTDPINVYGMQKLKAEELILNKYPTAAVCRMPLMFGDSNNNSKSFLQSITDAIKYKKVIGLFTDEFRSPCSAISASSGLLMAIKRFHGIFHLGGKESISRMEFGNYVAQVIGASNKYFLPILQNAVPTKAPRPKDLTLLSPKATILGFSPLSIRDELQKLNCL